MKIYFAGSIRGGRDDASLYRQLIQYLKKYGGVLTEHIGNEEMTASGENELPAQYVHDRDMKWMEESDVIVAEVSMFSLGVGYEIGRAVAMGKPILCLHRNPDNKKLSAMIDGCSGITNVRYADLDEAKKIIDQFLSKIK